MTPGQILMYCGPEAVEWHEKQTEERELASGREIKTHPETGKRYVTVENREDAMAIIAKIQEAKSLKEAGSA